MSPNDAVSAEAPYHRFEIDGIPAYLAPNAIRYTGALLFRAGRADEPLRHSGLSHLVEHLALFGLGLNQPYSFNGWVGGLFTCFYATGTPEEVGEFLNAVAKGLRELPLARLPDEARVMRTEAAARSAGPMGELLWLRYGATGHGKTGMAEFELMAPDPEAVSEWARSRYTAGNAALWFTGPPPPNLALCLLPGPRIPAPELTPVLDVSYPAWVHGNPGGIAISFARPRGEWLSIPLHIAAERVRARLRHEGVIYDVAMEYEPIHRDFAHAMLWTGCLPDHATAVRDGILGVLDEVARSGATPEELERTREKSRRSMRDPEAVAEQLLSASMNELLGFPVKSPADLELEMEAMDPAATARLLSSALETALLILPPTCPPPPTRFLQYPSFSSTTIEGRQFRETTASFPWSKGPRLVVGGSGVSLVIDKDRSITVPYASCAAAIRYPGGVLDVFGEDGFRVRVDPCAWRKGEEAVDSLIELVPVGRLLRIQEAAAG